MSEPAASTPLNEADLLAAAQAATGLSDWGTDHTYKIGLEKLIAAVNDMRPSASFLQQARVRLVNSLTYKLHYVDEEKRHPDILAQKIERPVVIIGLPRTGTTVTFDLLALDPATRTPRNWEFQTPWPAPDAAHWESDPRRAQLDAVYRHLQQQSPRLADIQVMDAHHPAECNLAFTHHFASTQFAALWSVPSYTPWLRGLRSVPGRYAAHKRILQELQWKGPKGRWTLKSPEHLCTIEGLVEAYPDACLVWTHRDPVSAFSSVSSMISQMQAAFGLQPDRQAIGRYVVDTWATALEHATDVRTKNPQVEQKIIDIAHRDVIKDKPEVVARIHARFGLPFTSEHEARVRSAASGRVSERLGRHKHAPADYGIDAGEVRARLPKYMARFGALF